MNIDFHYGFYINDGRYFDISAFLNASPDFYFDLRKVLEIKRIVGHEFTRVGNPSCDGGYVMVNDFKLGGVAYSFGISNEISWDEGMAERGYEVYMYDHTIDAPPFMRQGFHFLKEGLSGYNESNNPLKTLNHYIRVNGHQDEQNMILKIDIEGAEWNFLKMVNSNVLKQFDQIVIELHNLLDGYYGKEIIKLLNKLNKTHQLVHLHGNNSAFYIKTGNALFPNVVEATFVNREKYQFTDCPDIELPTILDAHNDNNKSDIILGKWNSPLEL